MGFLPNFSFEIAESIKIALCLEAAIFSPSWTQQLLKSEINTFIFSNVPFSWFKQFCCKILSSRFVHFFYQGFVGFVLFAFRMNDLPARQTIASSSKFLYIVRCYRRAGCPWRGCLPGLIDLWRNNEKNVKRPMSLEQYALLVSCPWLAHVHTIQQLRFDQVFFWQSSHGTEFSWTMCPSCPVADVPGHQPKPRWWKQFNAVVHISRQVHCSEEMSIDKFVEKTFLGAWTNRNINNPGLLTEGWHNPVRQCRSTRWPHLSSPWHSCAGRFG